MCVNLIDTPERRDVDGLSADDASASNAGRVLARPAINDGGHKHLDRVLQQGLTHAARSAIPQ